MAKWTVPSPEQQQAAIRVARTWDPLGNLHKEGAAILLRAAEAAREASERRRTANRIIVAIAVGGVLLIMGAAVAEATDSGNEPSAAASVMSEIGTALLTGSVVGGVVEASNRLHGRSAATFDRIQTELATLGSQADIFRRFISSRYAFLTDDDSDTHVPMWHVLSAIGRGDHLQD